MYVDMQYAMIIFFFSFLDMLQLLHSTADFTTLEKETQVGHIALWDTLSSTADYRAMEITEIIYFLKYSLVYTEYNVFRNLTAC